MTNNNFIGGFMYKANGSYINNNGTLATFANVGLEGENMQLPFVLNISDTNTTVQESIAQMPVIQIRGTLTTSRDILLPKANRITTILNGTAFPITIKAAGGNTTGVIIQPGNADDIVIRKTSLDAQSLMNTKGFYQGAISPKNSLTAVAGSLYRSTDGSLYFNYNGANTGWGKVFLGARSNYVTNGSGQTTINIPHGLGVLPLYTNINPKSADAKAAGIISWTEDATNIVIILSTPANTGIANLVYVWEASI